MFAGQNLISNLRQYKDNYCKKTNTSGENRLTLSFKYDIDFISIIKNINDARWSSTMKCWHVPDKADLDVETFKRPRREHRLPNVLSKEEIKAILQAPSNLKHKAMLSLIYACGLRRSELLNLKPVDIDRMRGILLIRQSKGKKDRIIPISDKIIKLLEDYYISCRPVNWLFEGQVKGNRYSEKSLESVLKQSLVKAGIKKPVTLHWLRHSYATHLTFLRLTHRIWLIAPEKLRGIKELAVKIIYTFNKN
jgi:site-specific recombinase XerD